MYYEIIIEKGTINCKGKVSFSNKELLAWGLE